MFKFHDNVSLRNVIGENRLFKKRIISHNNRDNFYYIIAMHQVILDFSYESSQCEIVKS